MDNQYGLDNQYFEKWIDRIRRNGFSNWKPDELARELARMSKAADAAVMHEPEFDYTGGDKALLHHRMSIDLMADCMNQTRLDLIEAGVISESVPPMFVADAVIIKVRQLVSKGDVGD